MGPGEQPSVPELLLLSLGFIPNPLVKELRRERTRAPWKMRFLVTPLLQCSLGGLGPGRGDKGQRVTVGADPAPSVLGSEGDLSRVLGQRELQKSTQVLTRLTVLPWRTNPAAGVCPGPPLATSALPAPPRAAASRFWLFFFPQLLCMKQSQFFFGSFTCACSSQTTLKAEKILSGFLFKCSTAL